MMMGTDTRVRVSEETWQALNERKDEPGETFDDVVQRLLDNDEQNPSK